MTLKNVTLMVVIFAIMSVIVPLFDSFYGPFFEPLYWIDCAYGVNLESIYKLIIAMFFFVLYKKMK